MTLCKLKRCSSLNLIRSMCYDVKPELLHFYCKAFDVPSHRIQSILIKHPSLQKLTEEHINSTIEVFNRFNLQKHELLEQPKLLNFYPIIIENRLLVFKECGFHKIDSKILARYVQIVAGEYFYKIQKKGLIEDKNNLYRHLVNSFQESPNILDHLTINVPHIERLTLCKIREYILRLFLQAKYNISNNKFQFILKTYPPVKHKPFEKISRVLYMLEKELEFPKKMILSNGFCFMLEPENITGLLNEVKTFGGQDIKELITSYPSILRTNYKSILEIKRILKEEQIPDEVQIRCPEICRLSPDGLQKRIHDLKSTNNFKGYAENSRAMELVYHYNKVYKRLNSLSESNKKCQSIHKLVSSSKEFDRYLKKSEDKSKGVDIVKALKKYFKSVINNEDEIRVQLRRQPFWTHASLASVIQVYEYLSQHFETIDIFHNCPLLLYQLNDVIDVTSTYLDVKNTGYTENSANFSEFTRLGLETLSGRQIISLILYYIERQYHFTGYGLMKSEEKKEEEYIK